MKRNPTCSHVSFPLCALALLALAGSASAQLEDPIPKRIETAGPTLKLVPVADGLTAPNWGTYAPGHPRRLFVTDQDGIIWNIDLATGDKAVFADLAPRLVPLGIGGPGTYDERGLLSLAFHPDYAQNGLLYTHTSEPVDGEADFSTMPPGANPNHQSVFMEWTVADPSDPDATVDPASGREFMRIDQPQFNHDGGAFVFGPDGMLYISLGDGGASDDSGNGHVEGGNAQEPGNILGTVLRLDPLGSNSPNGEYGIPADNPFVDDDAVLDEIWAYGFRNPFRFSFDRETGELYLADVGQNDIEEIDILTAGGNYGWRTKEGSFLFDPNGSQPGFVYGESGDGPEDLIDPIAEYDHDEGIAVVGGFVYRGDEIADLEGWYVFGDYADPQGDWGRLFLIRKGADDSPVPVHEARLEGGGLQHLVLGFGEDASGEIYLLGGTAGVPFGDTGVVMKLALSTGAGGGAAPITPRVVASRATPNPFNPRTHIEFEMPSSDHLAVAVYDLRGALVRSLLDEVVPAGPGVVAWDGTDAAGRAVSSGMYFYEVRAFGQRSLAKITLAK